MKTVGFKIVFNLLFYVSVETFGVLRSSEFRWEHLSSIFETNERALGFVLFNNCSYVSQNTQKHVDLKILSTLTYCQTNQRRFKDQYAISKKSVMHCILRIIAKPLQLQNIKSA